MSKRLCEILGHSYVEMDQLFWEPNWKFPLEEKFFEKLRAALDQEHWILDGNYTRTIPIKWERVEMVVWLDYSFSRTLTQAIKRALWRSMTKIELWPGTGNRESFRKSFFSRDSIIWWTITTHKKVRVKYEKCMADPKFAHIKFVRLRNHEEAENFLNEMKKKYALAKP